MKILILLSLALLFYSITALANQDCSDQISVSQYKKILFDKNRSLMALRNRIEARDDYTKSVARKLNPELEFFTVKGRDYSVDKMILSETRLWFQWQSGDKVNKKRGLAGSETDRVVVDRELTKYELVRGTLSKLLRIQQIKEELQFRKTAIEEINRVWRKYMSKPYLSPDQNIELGILDLIRDDFEIKKTDIDTEETYLGFLLRDFISHDCEFKSFTDYKLKMPTNLSAINEFNDLPSLKVRFANADLEVKKHSLSVEHSKAFPDIKIGPLVQTYSNGGPHYMTAGFMFVAPLPVLDRNQGARTLSHIDVKLAEFELDRVKKQETDLTALRVTQYLKHIELLEKAKGLEKVKEKLKRVSTLFDQGRVSLMLLVELQRQLNDLMAQYHMKEMVALQELIDLYEIKGLEVDKIYDLVIF